MMSQARVLECVRVHVDAVIVCVVMLVLVDVFENVVVNMDVFRLIVSNVWVETIVNVAMFMLVLVKVFANVSISIIQLHIYHMHILHTSSSKCSTNPTTNRRNAMRRDETDASLKALTSLIEPYEVLTSPIEPLKALKSLRYIMTVLRSWWRNYLHILRKHRTPHTTLRRGAAYRWPAAMMPFCSILMASQDDDLVHEIQGTEDTVVVSSTLAITCVNPFRKF